MLMWRREPFWRVFLKMETRLFFPLWISSPWEAVKFGLQYFLTELCCYTVVTFWLFCLYILHVFNIFKARRSVTAMHCDILLTQPCLCILSLVYKNFLLLGLLLSSAFQPQDSLVIVTGNHENFRWTQNIISPLPGSGDGIYRWKCVLLF